VVNRVDAPRRKGGDNNRSMTARFSDLARRERSLDYLGGEG
jgi:hypothetical protein